ncbi:hypothetical protein [Endozoicomonas sp. SCSIO W0465]|uniref:hypothetical protein n=1 Tax=Endozoicomonas sp. SCSIO W0465 TaxID=2918516 RepID=UPI002075523E|nr:hypothetical protein [Endozoicomonas sp. SCSIO W0465]USE34569.1 hypothetical protein MJO57_20830 [Endozoicomonas sp. SCSIO W0465]
MLNSYKKILSNSDEDQVTQQLKKLHSKTVIPGRESSGQWVGSIVDIMKDSDLAHFPVIHFAHKAFESGWLEPPSTDDSDIYLMEARNHHDLLVRFGGVDELKTKAASCLKQWYQELLSREKNSQYWQYAYECHQKNQKHPFFVTHCHGGASYFLEEKIASTSLQTSWTDEPDGVPDIERMLVHNPAFPQFFSGKGNHRPVIIVGQPSWCSPVFNEKVEVLLQRKIENNSELKKIFYIMNIHNEVSAQRQFELKKLHKQYYPDGSEEIRSPGNPCIQLDGQPKKAVEKAFEEKKQEINRKYWRNTLPDVTFRERESISDLETQCKRAIQQAFSHYLYRVTHSKGGCLTYCWVDASFKSVRGESTQNYGTHEPSSPEELYAMMSQIDSPSWCEKSVNDTYLRQVHNASNALVLKPDDLTKITEEFSNSVNLGLLYDSL